jgi:hypothetical protein
MFISKAIAQSSEEIEDTLGKKIPVPTADELNVLKLFAPYIDIILLFTVAYNLYLYFMDFQTEKAFLKMIPIAFMVFMATQWRTVLGWFGVFGV